MKYRYNYTHQFKKDVRLCQRQGWPMQELKDAISILLEQGSLPPEYKAHKLSGNMNGIWECHIRPNWLLVWEQNDDELIMLMLCTGTHQEVFGL